MSRSIIALALALALLTPGVLSGTSGSTLSLTAASFSADPSTVFDNTNAAAGTAGADATAWGSGYDAAWFGPGSDNTTVITYALDDASSLNKIIARVSNGSLISNDTADTTLYAKKSETTATITAVTAVSKQVAVGLGSIAIAYSAASGVATAGYTTHQNVYLLIVNSAGSVVANTAIVSTAHTVCSTTATPNVNGLFYTYVINSLFYENSTYYVSYTTVANTLTIASGACVTTGATQVETKATLQGYSVASTPVAKWTTAADYVTSTAATAGTFSSKCGPQNYTNSTSIYCTAYSDATTTRTLNAYPITVATGAVGSAVAIAADSVPTGQTVKYTVAGFVYGMYQQGILLNCLTTTTAGPTYANTLNLYNFTSGATSTTGATSGGIVLTGYSTTTLAGSFSGAGVQNGTGFLLLTQYQSAAATTGADSQTPAVTTYQYTTYNGSAVKQGDTVTIGTAAAGGNWFVDAYGALWFGAYSRGYTTDSTAGNSGTYTEIYKGQVGKVIAQLYSDAGSILASFFALLSIMIAAVFAF